MGRTGWSAPSLIMDPVPASHAPADAGAVSAKLHELLREHRFDEVLATAQAVLERSPGHRAALLCTAIAQRFRGKIPEAFATLASLEQHHPQFSRLYEERGRCFVPLREAQPAREAFLKPVYVHRP